MIRIKTGLLRIRAIQFIELLLQKVNYETLQHHVGTNGQM